MKYTQIIPVFLVFITGCSSKSIWEESVFLENVKPVQGKHCESSAIVNALHYLEYDIDEVMFTGSGATPSYIYDKGSFPFLGGRTLSMRENAFQNLGIKWSVIKPGNDDPQWDTIYELLQEGYPVVLRVDMRYLPYLWGGKYGNKYTSFGWHMITLFGIDSQKNTAYITDTEFSGLQEISLKDLTKARSSRTNMFAPENEFLWIEKPPVNYKYNLEDVLYNSIDQYINNFTEDNGPLIGMRGISGLSEEIEDIESSVKSYMLQPVFGFLSGSIETNGTGGGFFRNFYSEYLHRAAAMLDDDFLRTAAESAAICAQSWTELADEFQSISEDIKDIKKKEKRDERYKRAVLIARRIYEEEKILLSNLIEYREKENR